MEQYHLAAASGNGSFWPHGVVTLVVMIVVCALVGVRQSRKARKGTGDPGT